MNLTHSLPSPPPQTQATNKPEASVATAASGTPHFGLTPRQAECLAFVTEYIGNNGFAPTLEEIAVGLGLSSKARVFGLLAALEKRGAIRRISGHARSIQVIGRRKSLNAEVHLRAILDAFKNDNILWRNDPAVKAARAYLEGRS